MPVLKANDYKPPFWLKSGHLNTVYPYLFRKRPIIPFKRLRINTLDNDFFDIDTIETGNSRVAILCHGLEGSSDSQYIKGTSYALSQNNWDVIAINFRSCSGEMNLGQKLYHSGFTEDLHHVIQKYKSIYEEIALVGFSLGGNVVMKYTGDQKYTIPDNVIVTTGVSVPCDLKGGSYRIAEKQNFLYQKNFLQSLFIKMKQKANNFSDVIDIDKIKITKTLMDFDHHFNAPLHGFKDGFDYYDQCNSKQFLKNIRIPSLIINALDDTFLPETSFPYDEAEKNPDLFLMTPKHGGHVGFTTKGSKYYWNEDKILQFLNQFSKHNSDI